MTTTISRMYASHGQAMAAVAELENYGFGRGDIHVVGHPGTPGAESGAADAVMAALLKAYVLRAHAKVFAEGILRGGTLVVVHAPFGSAEAARTALDSAGPVDSGVPEPKPDYIDWDEAAPLSSGLQLPVLSRDPTPCSNFWGLPVLTRSQSSWSELASPHFTFSGMFGMGLLSRNPAPLSSMFGLKVLTGR